METKRKPSSNVLKGNEKRPRRLSNDLSSSSPATSDLFESDLDVLEETLINTEKKAGKEKTGTSFGSPPTSDLFEPEVSEPSQDNEDDIGCVPLEDSEDEEGPSLKDSDIKETSFDFSQLNGALVFIHLPGSSRGSLKQIISILMESGAEVSEFFHRKITHLITSNRYLEVEKNNILTSNKLLTDPSSRGAVILAKTTKKQDNANIVDKAKKLGVNVIFLEEMNLEFLSRQKSLLDHTLVTDSTLCLKRTANDVPSVEVRELRTPFLKVVDHSECYRPLVLEMKEWPDAFTMFSQGPNVLETRVKKKKEK
ncbi:Cdc7p-Dbf4p kinase complex regulatory subunit [Desmophyllum pertusum]|uniref:Cdc7p-Dbf4p kinase complex regulatory subunit n=1 Tax=Desmophyllum pertusum TaxID=174260 RepID=A0A9W9Y8J5_9CNID|nr:Cdc7p-Dbf4p kinase complex regulatory subunit [Desmophyllum pertusum]